MECIQKTRKHNTCMCACMRKKGKRERLEFQVTWHSWNKCMTGEKRQLQEKKKRERKCLLLLRSKIECPTKLKASLIRQMVTMNQKPWTKLHLNKDSLERIMCFVEHNVFCDLITGYYEHKKKTFRNANFPIQSVMLMVME